MWRDGSGRRIAAAAVAATAALSLFGCSSESKSGSSTTPSSTSAAASSSTAQAGAVDVDARYKMKATYEDASGSDARAGQQLMESNQLLEILANNVNKYL